MLGVADVFMLGFSEVRGLPSRSKKSMRYSSSG